MLRSARPRTSSQIHVQDEVEHAQTHKESLETLKPVKEAGLSHIDASKSFRARDAGIEAINDQDRFKL
jgi:hypothetical protein